MSAFTPPTMETASHLKPHRTNQLPLFSFSLKNMTSPSHPQTRPTTSHCTHSGSVRILHGGSTETFGTPSPNPLDKIYPYVGPRASPRGKAVES